MTVRDIANETKDLVREGWWNGVGAAVVCFLVVTFIWKRPDNDYLLYAALIFVGLHAGISAQSFGRSRSERQHRKDIAVAYREHLKATQKAQSRESIHGPDRSLAGRRREPAYGVARKDHRFVGVPAI